MSIKISKFGKIKSADIAFDGLTVIAGQNDTGKSTVGKSLFSIVKSVIDFPQLYVELVQRRAFAKLSPILFEITKRDSKKNKVFWDMRSEILNSIFDENNHNLYKKINDYMEQIAYHIESTKVDSNIRNQIKDIINELNKECNNDKKFKEISEYIFSRNFKREYNNSLSREKSRIEYSVGNASIATIEFEKNKITSAHIDVDCKATSFRDVTLIESPLYLEESHDARSPYVNDLKEKLNKAKTLFDERNENLDILQQIDNILGQGKFSYDSEKKKLKYTVSKGADPLDIENIASGSKTFGMIYLLLKTGILTKDSLLVLDEPENHLHPEWQIKLAKIIIALIKNDFYVLLTSHSPTFIHALMKYGSNYIEKKDKVKFYLAEKEIEQNYSKLTEIENVNLIFENLLSPNDILYFD